MDPFYRQYLSSRYINSNTEPNSEPSTNNNNDIKANNTNTNTNTNSNTNSNTNTNPNPIANNPNNPNLQTMPIPISTPRPRPKHHYKLSTQELLDCDIYNNKGCYGGNPIDAFQYILEHGVGIEESDPYQGEVCI